MEVAFLTLPPCWLLGTSSQARCRALYVSGKGIQRERGRWPRAAFDLRCEPLVESGIDHFCQDYLQPVYSLDALPSSPRLLSGKGAEGT